MLQFAYELVHSSLRILIYLREQVQSVNMRDRSFVVFIEWTIRVVLDPADCLHRFTKKPIVKIASCLCRNTWSFHLLLQQDLLAFSQHFYCRYSQWWRLSSLTTKQRRTKQRASSLPRFSVIPHWMIGLRLRTMSTAHLCHGKRSRRGLLNPFL